MISEVPNGRIDAAIEAYNERLRANETEQQERDGHVVWYKQQMATLGRDIYNRAQEKGIPQEPIMLSVGVATHERVHQGLFSTYINTTYRYQLTEIDQGWPLVDVKYVPSSRDESGQHPYLVYVDDKGKLTVATTLGLHHDEFVKSTDVDLIHRQLRSKYNEVNSQYVTPIVCAQRSDAERMLEWDIAHFAPGLARLFGDSK